MIEKTSLSIKTYINASMKKLLLKRTFFTKKVILKEVSVAMMKIIIEAISKISQVDLISKNFYDAFKESQFFNELNLCQEIIIRCDEPATCEEVAVLCHVSAFYEAIITFYDESVSCEAIAVSCNESAIEEISSKAKKEKKKKKKEKNKKMKTDKKIRRIESKMKSVIKINIATESELLLKSVSKIESSIESEKSHDMLEQILLCLANNNMTDRDKCEIIEKVIKN